MEVFEKRAHKEYLKTYRYHKLPSEKNQMGSLSKRKDENSIYLYTKISAPSKTTILSID